MRADRPGNLLVDIGRHHLRAPIAVIGPNKSDDTDVVHKTGEHHLLVHPGLDRVSRTLQQMIRRAEPVFEEVHQGRLVRHFRQPRVVAHQEMLAGVLRQQGRAVRDAQIAVGEVEQARLYDDRPIELAHHVVLERVGALGECHCIVHFRCLYDRVTRCRSLAKCGLCAPALDGAKAAGYVSWWLIRWSNRCPTLKS